MNSFVLVAAGGALGSMLRFYINNLFPFQGVNFPKSTFIVNILASLILGLVTGVLIFKLPENDWLKYFMAVGFCGGFSTFSTFAFEMYKLQENNNLLMSMSYALISIIFSILAIYLGILITKNIIL